MDGSPFGIAVDELCIHLIGLQGPVGKIAGLGKDGLQGICQVSGRSGIVSAVSSSRRPFLASRGSHWIPNRRIEGGSHIERTASNAAKRREANWHLLKMQGALPRE